MTACKLLIVDDELSILKSVSGLLKSEYGTPLQASNGMEALRIIKEERPSIMVLDVTLPRMNGIEVLKAALAIHPALIVIMLTGQFDTETVKQCLRLGAKQYITKPFEIGILRLTIERLLERRRPTIPDEAH